MTSRSLPLRLAPTRNMGGFLFMLVAMWYAGASQGNGAAYLLFFMLFGVVLVSIPRTFANLGGLRVTPGAIKPAFAGQEVSLALEIVNPSRKPRHGIAATIPGKLVTSEPVDELPGESAAWAVMRFPAPKRGMHEVTVVQLSSAYPIGFVQVRRRLPVSQQYVVYPRPAGEAAFPPAPGSAVRRSEGVEVQGDDFTGVRAYVPGESQRHVDWKAVARGQPMMTKQFAAENDGTLHFDFSAMPMRGVEARLSQLALWIIEAERTRRRYSLRLPEVNIPAALGESHYHNCLRALALHA